VDRKLLHEERTLQSHQTGTTSSADHKSGPYPEAKVMGLAEQLKPESWRPEMDATCAETGRVLCKSAVYLGG
jgi:hypothetical protein